MPEGPLARSSATRRRTVVTGLAVAFVTLACGGLLGAAALAPAPAVVLPLIIVACLACPMLAVAEFVTSVSRPSVSAGLAYSTASAHGNDA